MTVWGIATQIPTMTRNKCQPKHVTCRKVSQAAVDSVRNSNVFKWLCPSCLGGGGHLGYSRAQADHR
jgi:hypothetical protein